MKNLTTNQIIGILLAAIVLFYIWKKGKDKLEQTEISANTSSDGVPVSSGSSSKPIPAWEKKYNALPTLGDDAILKKGTKSKEVWKVQHLYNEKIAKPNRFTTIAVDGIFGSQTERAVKYVLENKYNFTRLRTWRNWVEMTKAERIAQLKKQTSNSNSGSSSTPLAQISPSDNTFVYNPFNY